MTNYVYAERHELLVFMEHENKKTAWLNVQFPQTGKELLCMLRDMFKKTYTKIDMRYRAEEKESARSRAGRRTGNSCRSVEKM